MKCRSPAFTTVDIYFLPLFMLIYRRFLLLEKYEWKTSGCEQYVICVAVFVQRRAAWLVLPVDPLPWLTHRVIRFPRSLTLTTCVIRRGKCWPTNPVS